MRIILVSLCMFLLLSANAQVNSLDRYHPRALIAELKIDSCQVLLLLADGSTKVEQTIVYDADGYELENIVYKNGMSDKYFYDSLHRKSVWYSVPFNDIYYEKDTFIYDKKNNLIFNITYNNFNIETSRSEYIYLGNNMITNKFYIDSQLRLVTNFEYDKQNHLTTGQNFYLGKPNGFNTYKYDKAGNQTEFKVTDNKGVVTLTQKMEYNKQGNRTGLEAFNNVFEEAYCQRTVYLQNGLINYEEFFTGYLDQKTPGKNYKKKLYRYF